MNARPFVALDNNFEHEYSTQSNSHALFLFEILFFILIIIKEIYFLIPLISFTILFHYFNIFKVDLINL